MPTTQKMSRTEEVETLNHKMLQNLLKPGSLVSTRDTVTHFYVSRSAEKEKKRGLLFISSQLLMVGRLKPRDQTHHVFDRRNVRKRKKLHLYHSFFLHPAFMSNPWYMKRLTCLPASKQSFSTLDSDSTGPE